MYGVKALPSVQFGGFSFQKLICRRKFVFDGTQTGFPFCKRQRIFCLSKALLLVASVNNMIWKFLQIKNNVANGQYVEIRNNKFDALFFKERAKSKTKLWKCQETTLLCKLFYKKKLPKKVCWESVKKTLLNIAFVLKYKSNLKQALQTGFGEIPKRPKGRPC